MHPVGSDHPALKIALNPQEEAYLAQVRFDVPEHPDAGWQRALLAGCSLARSLVARGAVPRARWRYFTDPELNIGRKKSRKDTFEANGVRGADILLDAAFLPYLYYWIFGPDLPEAVIGWFLAAAQHGSDMRSLRHLARQATRDCCLEPLNAAEEFFKLALEAGLDQDSARSVRDAVHSMRGVQSGPRPVKSLTQG